MNYKPIFISFLMAWSCLDASAQVSLNVDLAQQGAKVSPMLYGIFFEDINHAADGGLIPNMLSSKLLTEERYRSV